MEVRFVADEMNGDLARWLRILGYDCIYFKGEVNMDQKIIKLACQDGRIVLTSDRALYRRCSKRNIEAIITCGIKREERIACIAKAINLDISLGCRTARCSICNGILQQTNDEPKEKKGDKKILDAHFPVWKCMECGNLYWEGSHWYGIRKIITDAGNIIKG